MKKFGFLLILAFTTFFSSCEKDLYEEAINENNTQGKIILENFSLKSNNSSIELLKTVRKFNQLKKHKANARMVYDSILNFYYDDEKGIHLQINDKHSYTFSVARPNGDGKLENIIFNSKEDGTFGVYVVKYEMTNEQLKTMSQTQIENIDKTIKEIDLDTGGQVSNAACWCPVLVEDPRYFRPSGDGITDILIPTDNLYTIAWVPCDCGTSGGNGGLSNGDGIGGSGANGTSSGWGSSGSTTGDGHGLDGSGGGGNGGVYTTVVSYSDATLFINSLGGAADSFTALSDDAQQSVFLYVANHVANKQNVIDALNQMNIAWISYQEPAVQKAIFDYLADNNWDSTSLDLINQLDENPALMQTLNPYIIENKINDTNLDPCAKDILHQLRYLQQNDIAKMLNRFGSFPSSYSLTFKSIIPNNPLNSAETDWLRDTNQNAVENNYLIKIKPLYTNYATKIAIARTLMHEMIHAYILSSIDALDVNSNVNPTDFPMIYQALLNQTYDNNPNQLHHMQMSRKFVLALRDALQEYDNSTKSLQYYEDLAWGGLEQTSSFNTLFPVGSADRDRILATNAAEDNNSEFTFGDFTKTPQDIPCQ